MGTRHLIAVHVNGKYPVAQYGQWDGHPDVQGADLLSILSNIDLSSLREKCLNAHWITEEELKAIEADPHWKQRWPWMSRDAGAKIIEYVMAHEGSIPLSNNIGFAGDGLMCEWAYVIDLDTGILEVFKGFNKSPLPDSDRFAKMEGLESCNNRYFPVRSVRQYPLNSLPSKEAFLADFHVFENE